MDNVYAVLTLPCGFNYDNVKSEPKFREYVLFCVMMFWLAPYSIFELSGIVWFEIQRTQEGSLTRLRFRKLKRQHWIPETSFWVLACRWAIRDFVQVYNMFQDLLSFSHLDLRSSEVFQHLSRHLELTDFCWCLVPPTRLQDTSCNCEAKAAEHWDHEEGYAITKVSWQGTTIAKIFKF